MSKARPESLVLVLVLGLGIIIKRWPFLQMDSPRSLAWARSSLSHSRVTLVWVTLRTRSRGGSGSFEPYSEKMACWRSQKAVEVARSAATLREHEMLTIEPGPTPRGRRREGNSMRWTDWGRRTWRGAGSLAGGGGGKGRERELTSEMRTAMPAGGSKTR